MYVLFTGNRTEASIRPSVPRSPDRRPEGVRLPLSRMDPGALSASRTRRSRASSGRSGVTRGEPTWTEVNGVVPSELRDRRPGRLGLLDAPALALGEFVGHQAVETAVHLVVVGPEDPGEVRGDVGPTALAFWHRLTACMTEPPKKGICTIPRKDGITYRVQEISRLRRPASRRERPGAGACNGCPGRRNPGTGRSFTGSKLSPESAEVLGVVHAALVMPAWLSAVGALYFALEEL